MRQKNALGKPQHDGYPVGGKSNLTMKPIVFTDGVVSSLKAQGLDVDAVRQAVQLPGASRAAPAMAREAVRKIGDTMIRILYREDETAIRVLSVTVDKT